MQIESKAKTENGKRKSLCVSRTPQRCNRTSQKGDMTANPDLLFPSRKFLGFISRFYLCSSAFSCGAFFLLFSLSLAPPAPAQEKVDLLITGGTVITMDAERRVLDDGAIAVRGDSIVAIGA